MSDADMHASLRQLASARDVVQLEYSLARTSRKGIRGKMVVGKADIGELLGAFINEYQKFNELIEINFELQAARVKALENSRHFKEWALSGTGQELEAETTIEAKKQNRIEQNS